eukprot:GFKZ01009433.1.p1 GENE.GFKZ01009433.1~~GFKZ01009433.1.p1  ORF type:complete len:526 (+),score=89.70 GFKZ01009433.1:47-1624(+)
MQREKSSARQGSFRREETPEQRKERREAKRRRKEERRARREARAHQDEDVSPLSKRARTDLAADPVETTARNTNVFVWKKKIEQQRRRGEKVEAQDEERRLRELAEELEAAKRRRAQRDLERAQWEEEKAREQREREQAENADWHRGEASFHGVQHFLRQGIRIREHRPIGTDFLAKNIRLDLLDIEADAVGPVARLKEMDMADIEEMAEAVEKELDYIPDYPTEDDNERFNRSFRLEWWQKIKICVKCMRESAQTAGGSVHHAVRADVQKLLHGKSLPRLRDMEAEISNRIQPDADQHGFEEVDFWTEALVRIRQLIAEHRLHEMNDLLLKERALRIAALPKPVGSKAKREDDVTSKDDKTELEMLNEEKDKGMGTDEEQFADEVDARSRQREFLPPGYSWNDKYRPRKPRYYNRVHTGFDWTKYNRTHYDHDNPPPKTVRGYRFNIFYPDLIDPSKTPTFVLSKTDNPDVSIITFKAGPPYEDLAFKIVNRSWEHSHRKGYRCTFDKGILQVWFNFQRYRYRR